MVVRAIKKLKFSRPGQPREAFYFTRRTRQDATPTRGLHPMLGLCANDIVARDATFGHWNLRIEMLPGGISLSDVTCMMRVMRWIGVSQCPCKIVEMCSQNIGKVEAT